MDAHNSQLPILIISIAINCLFARHFYHTTDVYPRKFIPLLQRPLFVECVLLLGARIGWRAEGKGGGTKTYIESRLDAFSLASNVVRCQFPAP